MSKTIQEVQLTKKQLEYKISQMLLNFEQEYGVTVDCIYSDTPIGLIPQRTINITISVSL